MKILVTGGAGFIGSHFVRHVLQKYPSSSVINLDKLTYAGNRDNLRDVEADPRYRFVRGDIRDPAVVLDAARGVDAVVNFAAESLAPDTLIPVHVGYAIRLRTIEEIFAQHARAGGVTVDAEGTEIAKVKGKLLALSFRNGMGVWSRVIHVTRHWWKGKLTRLSQKWGEVRVTPNHSVYDAHGDLVEAASNPELLAIRKINVDRSRHRGFVVLRLPRGSSRGMKNRVFFKKRLAAPKQSWVRRRYAGDRLKAFLRFLGAYVAEGNASFNRANGGWLVCISNKDLKFLRSIQGDVSKFSNVSGVLTQRGGRGVNQLVFSSRILYLLASTLCGRGSEHKRIPDFLFTLLDEFKREFLEAYLRGDGNAEKYKTVQSRRCTTVSRELTTGLGLLFSLMGIDYTLSFRESPPSRKFKRAYSFRLVSNYDMRSSSQLDEEEWEGYVYDLSVEGSHNFAAGIGCIVVHNTHVDRSILGAGEFVTTDVVGTFTLLEAVKELRIPRAIFVSTDEVYGSIERGAVAETAPLNPSNPYSASKAGADLLTLSYWKTYRLPAVITRSSNNFGSHQYPEKVIPLFVTNALENLPLPLYGDGRNVRDWLYVLDHCAAIDLVLHKGTEGEVYNIGEGAEVENIDLARRILRLLGKPESLIRPVKDRLGHDRRYALDSSKLRTLGWRPAHSFDDALAATVAWYREHEAWWRPLKSGEFRNYYERQYVKR